MSSRYTRRGNMDGREKMDEALSISCCSCGWTVRLQYTLIPPDAQFSSKDSLGSTCTHLGKVEQPMTNLMKIVTRGRILMPLSDTSLRDSIPRSDSGETKPPTPSERS